MNREEIPYPSSFISAPITEVIRAFAPEAEKLRSLHPQQLSIIYERKWFNLYVPEEYGGLALSLPDGLKIQEGLAWADGSVGWTVTLCSGANWFAGFLDRKVAQSLFKDPKICLAGSGRASGIAKRTAGGYTITGSWAYATGAPHATAFTANCLIEEAGITVNDMNGKPLVRAFVFLKDEVLVEDNWRSIGMIATASQRFKVEQLYVGEDRSFIIDSNHVVLSQPLYQYPFLQLAEATLAVNTAGMASRFIELGEEIATGKTDSTKMGGIMMHIHEARNTLQGLRGAFYEAVRLSWEAGLSNQPSTKALRPTTPAPISVSPTDFDPAALLNEVSRTSRNLAAGARQLVDDLYPLCGLVAADPLTEINRVWRNLHTASQHSLLAYPCEG